MFFNKKEEIDDIENKIISDIKALNIDIINNEHNGNIELTLGLAKTLYVLYSRHFRMDLNDSKWINRDRIVVSSSNIHSLITSILFTLGYNVLDEENKVISDVDTMSDTHGDGLGNAVGVSYGEKYLHNYFKNKNINLIDFYTYVVCTNLDLMKGSSLEALSLASSLKLNKLVVIYDENEKILNNDSNFKVDSIKFFESLNYNIIPVDRNSLTEINNAFIKTKESDRPSVIILRQGTNKQFENNYIDTDYVLTEEETSNLKKELDVRDIPFTVSSEVATKMQEMVNVRMSDQINESRKLIEKLHEDDQIIVEKWLSNDLSISDKDVDYKLELDEELITSQYKIINTLREKNPLFIGISNDLENSISYGNRDNVVSVQNGLSKIGLRNYSIFNLENIDKVIPSIKYSINKKLANIYILNRNKNSYIDKLNLSIDTGLTNLRNISSLMIFRPNDANELIGAYNVICGLKDEPACVIINNNKTLVKEESSINDVSKGAYVIKRENKNISAVIVATGYELDIALDVANTLNEKGYDIRVVSMPCVELFKKQSDKYREEILPFGTKTFVIEESNAYSWNEFVYNDKYLITPDKVEWYNSLNDIDTFKEKVVEKIENLLK